MVQACLARSIVRRKLMQRCQHPVLHCPEAIAQRTASLIRPEAVDNNPLLITCGSCRYCTLKSLECALSNRLKRYRLDGIGKSEVVVEFIVDPKAKKAIQHEKNKPTPPPRIPVSSLSSSSSSSGVSSDGPSEPHGPDALESEANDQPNSDQGDQGGETNHHGASIPTANRRPAPVTPPKKRPVANAPAGASVNANTATGARTNLNQHTPAGESVGTTAASQSEPGQEKAAQKRPRAPPTSSPRADDPSGDLSPSTPSTKQAKTSRSAAGRKSASRSEAASAATAHVGSSGLSQATVPSLTATTQAAPTGASPALDQVTPTRQSTDDSPSSDLVPSTAASTQPETHFVTPRPSRADHVRNPTKGPGAAIVDKRGDARHAPTSIPVGIVAGISSTPAPATSSAVRAVPRPVPSTTDFSTARPNDVWSGLQQDVANTIREAGMQAAAQTKKLKEEYDMVRPFVPSRFKIGCTFGLSDFDVSGTQGGIAEPR